MRFALILAFVSSVLFSAAPAAAGPEHDQVAQARKSPKVQKRRAARSAVKGKKKSTAKRAKASRKAKVKSEEVAMVDEEEAPAPEPTVELAPAVKRAPVEQATDDEVPPNEPKKRR